MAKGKGRRKGSRNRGYFYREGRGWYAKANGRYEPLEYENGDRMRDKNTPLADVKAAYHRLMAGIVDPAPDNSVTLLQVCTAYLAQVNDNGAPATLTVRRNTLFDFCFGLPSRFIPNGKDKPKPKESDYIHKGYSRVQIEDGQQLVDALRLTNVELRHADMMQVDASWGEFDFVLCHGVYSWVPPQMQEKILSIAGQQLTPDGIAYVSYNAFPGWHMRGIVREMMRFHALRFSNPYQQISEARRVLDLVSKHASGAKDAAYNQLIKQEADLLAKCDDSYIFHEHLEAYCEPLYFHEFIGRAREHGLDYLGEPCLGTMAPTNFGTEAHKALKSLARDAIELEQFMDFFSNRTFRKTLLHRAGRKPNYELQPSLVWPMYVSGSGRVKEPPVDYAKGVQTTFLSRTGNPVTTPLPLLKAAIVELTEHWPAAISFEELLTGSCRRLGVEITDHERTQLGRAILLVLTSSDMIEVFVEPSKFSLTPGEKPLASALAREQAKSGPLITTCRHEVARLAPAEQRVIQALDGTNNVTDVARITKTSKDLIRQQIEQFARLPVIVS
jgi:methyltransferase-like protein